ncbi:MAG TPA: hypothetical protein VMP11_12810 [Verrucomicrobiae bacterium]|nr:hypothetical protein [Verrucomicrobiae bacterium]
MPETKYLARLRGRLLDLGCPVFHVRRLVREVADHRDDLLRSAVVEGCSASEAEARADGQLGDPLDLAERLTVVARRSSWWGRHSLIGFGLVPVVVIPLLWGLLTAVGIWLEYAVGCGLNDERLHAAAGRPDGFRHICAAVHGADYVAIALVTFLFCWLTYRVAASFKWTVTVCAVSALYALVTGVFIQPHIPSIQPHNLTLGFNAHWPPYTIWSPQLIRFAIPLAILGLTYAIQRRAAERFRESAVA